MVQFVCFFVKFEETRFTNQIERAKQEGKKILMRKMMKALKVTVCSTFQAIE